MSILKPVQHYEVGMRPSPLPQRVRRLVGVDPRDTDAPVHQVEDIPNTVSRTAGFVRWSTLLPILLVVVVAALTMRRRPRSRGVWGD